MSINTPHQYILLMKIGPYCGYSLREIIEIKKKEEKKIGMFYIGYSGVFCRPNKIQEFVSQAILNKENVKVLFIETKSSFNTSKVDRFTKYSSDNYEWENLSKDVLLVGNKSRKHFAICGKNLKEEDFRLDLNQYCILNGMFPNKAKPLGDYFKYRVDKACGYYISSNRLDKKEVQVKYSCDLVSPFSVYIQ